MDGWMDSFHHYMLHFDGFNSQSLRFAGQVQRGNEYKVRVVSPDAHAIAVCPLSHFVLRLVKTAARLTGSLRMISFPVMTFLA